MNIIEKLNWRYATKQFDSSKKIPESDWNILEESLRLAPSSYGLQPWKFIVIQNPELRKKLKAVSWDQPQVEDSSHFVVLTTLKKIDAAHVKKFINSMAQQRGIETSSLKSYEELMSGDIIKGPRSAIAGFWAQRQAYIAMGFLMETAALMNIDACPMEGLDPEAYDKILELTSSPYATVAAVALGYRHADDKYQHLKKVRFTKEDVIEYR